MVFLTFGLKFYCMYVEDHYYTQACIRTIMLHSYLTTNEVGYNEKHIHMLLHAFHLLILLLCIVILDCVTLCSGTLVAISSVCQKY